MKPRAIARLENAARTAFGFDERDFRSWGDRALLGLSAALVILLIYLIVRGR